MTVCERDCGVDDGYGGVTVKVMGGDCGGLRGD
jgi:hypothetical protein